MSNHSQFDVHVVAPSYWKVTFENAPINLIDLDTVAVFQSANADFFMAHLDLLMDNKRAAAMPPGPTGLPQSRTTCCV